MTRELQEWKSITRSHCTIQILYFDNLKTEQLYQAVKLISNKYIAPNVHKALILHKSIREVNPNKTSKAQGFQKN